MADVSALLFPDPKSVSARLLPPGWPLIQPPLLLKLELVSRYLLFTHLTEEEGDVKMKVDLTS